MNSVFEKDYLILPSVCDAAGRLGVADSFALFMDIASEHAMELGVGYADLLRRELFWLTVKTKIRFFDRPALGQRVTLRTWPEAPDRVRCNRSYQIVRDGAVLVAGKTEWAAVNIHTQRPAPAREVFPPELEFYPSSACPEAFSRLPENSPEFREYARYRVRSTDIDVGGHMNNAAYPRVLLGSLSGEELRAMDINSAEAVFRAPCFEGEELSLQRMEAADQGSVFRLCRGEKAVFLARLGRD